MKQYIVSILSLCWLLVGCQQEELMEQPGTGYLSLEALTPQAATPQTITRAGVDEGLGFKVLDASGQVATVGDQAIEYAPNTNYQSQRFDLPEGNYTLVAYNQAYLDYNAGTMSWTNSDVGEAIHYIEHPFTITAGETNYLKAEVPMINFAVCLTSIQGEEFFQKFELVVTVGDRVLWLKKGDVGYFLPLAADEAATLSYCISYLNDDGESATGDAKTLTPEAGTCYEFVYNINTETVQVKE